LFAREREEREAGKILGGLGVDEFEVSECGLM
jgi:hypothetical protein